MTKTPETDDLARGNHVVPTEWAEQLERERDEASEKYDNLATEHMLVVNKLCEERDELLNEIKRLRLEAQREAEHHDRMVGELEKVYKERDDALKALKEK